MRTVTRNHHASPSRWLAPHPTATASFRDGVVVYEASTGRLFHLNHTAAQVWSLLREGNHEAAIVRDLVQAHGADPAAVQRDLAAFVGALRDAGLLGPRQEDGSKAVVAASPPRRTPALDAAYRVGRVTVRVVCYSASVAAAFAPLAAPAMVLDGTVAEACLTLYRDQGAFVLLRDSYVVERLTTAPAARWAMVRHLVSAGRQRSWLALLHAGAVAAPMGCLLLCGDSGAGKSTLLAGLLHAGFDFVADDILPLENSTGLVWPVRLAISIKQGSWPTIGTLFPELAGAPALHFGGRTMRYLWPGDSIGEIDATGCRATAVVFPRYAKGSSTVLTQLDPVRSLILLGEGGSILPSTDDGLAEFLAWWSQLPAYELHYDQLDEAVHEVRSLLRTSCKSSECATTWAPSLAVLAAEV